MKQTAVDWLYQRFLFAGYATPPEWRKQAKEMEKEQVINDYEAGLDNGTTEQDITGEQYYKEVYNTKEK
jgi:hypothetical protein